MDYSEITNQVKQAFDILYQAAKPQRGELLIVGCSTSEIMGSMIGSNSSEEAAEAVLNALIPCCKEKGLYLAVQGCEHINRAICTQCSIAEKLDLQPVWVEPWLHAGGACVTAAKRRIDDAVMVENLHSKATLGMDIGGTLIGMHLRPVVVPVHSDLRRIGSANLILAYSRPKYIGGPRARYSDLGEQ